MGSVVAARAAHVTLQGLRMTAPGLLSCSSFPALLALFIALLVSLLSVNPTEASCKLSSQQTFDCVIKVRTEWYTNRTRRGQWANGRWQEYNPTRRNMMTTMICP